VTKEQQYLENKVWLFLAFKQSVWPFEHCLDVYWNFLLATLGHGNCQWFFFLL